MEFGALLRRVHGAIAWQVELWRNHRFKVRLAELFEALKRLKLLVIHEARYT